MARTRAANYDAQRQFIRRLPDDAPVVKPLTMMLFGTMNWTFTWLKPEKGMSYAQFADLVTDVFAAGVEAASRNGCRHTAGRHRRLARASVR